MLKKKEKKNHNKQTKTNTENEEVLPHSVLNCYSQAIPLSLLL